MLIGFKKDEEIEKLLKDKRVVFVGPSNHLEGRGIGKLIDEYDVVCRVNQVFPKNLGEDYGSRTDIAFLNFSTRDITHYVFRMRETPNEARNIKRIVCPVIKAQHDWKGSVKDNANLINIFNIPTSFIDENSYQILYNQIGVEPNMGYLSIMTLLQYDIKELFVTGISFYLQLQGNHVVENYDIYYHKGHTAIPFQYKEWSPEDCHQIKPQINYFKSVILNEYRDKIKIDSYLNNLLQLNYHNVINFGD